MAEIEPSAPRDEPAGPAVDATEPLWAAMASGGDRRALGEAWLALQCRAIPQVSQGLLFLTEERGEDAIEAGLAANDATGDIVVWPPQGRGEPALVRAARRCLDEGTDIVFWAREEGGRALGIAAAVPLQEGARRLGAAAFLLSGGSGVDLAGLRERVRWSAGWFAADAARRGAASVRIRLDRTAGVLDLLAAAGEHRRIRASGLALANEIAARLGCQRVGIGLKGTSGALRLRALSHSASIRRHAGLVRTIETAMDEALDQTAAICLPSPADDPRIVRAHRALAQATGAAGVASVLLIAQGRCFGVVTAERGELPFSADDLAVLEAVAALAAPLLDAQARGARWLSGRLVEALGDTLRGLFGEGRPGLKLGALAAMVALVVLAVAEGPHRVTARTVLEGSIQRAAVVPFEGFIAQAPRRAGDVVQAGEVLAILDDRDLVLDRTRSTSETAKLQQKYNEALAKHDRVAMGVLQAQIAQATAQLRLTEEKIARARIAAPFAGIVVSGDFTQMIGSPVEKGKVLFEIAPLQGYRAVLQIDERDVRYVAPGQHGRLALAADPHRPLPLTVTRVTPVAAAEEGRNVFRVEAVLDEPLAAVLRPGLEGIGKVEVGTRSLLWIWTRSLVDWARLTAWKWLW